MSEFTFQGIHTIPESAAERILKLARQQNFQVWQIDLTKVSSKQELLTRIASRIRLPEYFGENWDSLEECLRDLNGAQGWLLVFENADHLLKMSINDLYPLCDVLNAVSEFWLQEGRSFGSLFVGSRSLEIHLLSGHS